MNKDTIESPDDKDINNDSAQLAEVGRIGQRFGDFTIKGAAPLRSANGRILWVLSCPRGHTRTARTTHLDRVAGCGVCRSTAAKRSAGKMHAAAERAIAARVGQTIGGFTIVAYAGPAPGGATWQLRCPGGGHERVTHTKRLPHVPAACPDCKAAERAKAKASPVYDRWLSRNHAGRLPTDWTGDDGFFRFEKAVGHPPSSTHKLVQLDPADPKSLSWLSPDEYSRHNRRLMLGGDRECVACARTLPVEEFLAAQSRRDHIKGRVTERCADCRRADPHPKGDNKAQHRVAERTKAKLIELKSAPCMDCGGTFPPVAMDFDHRQGTEKRDSVSKLGCRGKMSAMLAEIAKCDLVCSNCHRVRTWRRREGVGGSSVDA